RAHAQSAGTAATGSADLSRSQFSGCTPDEPGGSGCWRGVEHRTSRRCGGGALLRTDAGSARPAVPGPSQNGCGFDRGAIIRMLSRLSARIERWPLRVPFRISRGVRTEAVVVVAEAQGEQGVVGRGECTPYARYGETPESVLAQMESMAGQAAAISHESLTALLPPGAARNAVDCALWDLEARSTGRPVEQLIGCDTPGAINTAVTISLDAPDAMAAAARAVADAPVIKIKVDGNRPELAIEAVARAAPRARLIVDANEAWSPELLHTLQPVLRSTGVTLVEQPLPAGADEALRNLDPLVPVCADESVHVADDLGRIASLYQFVNIKLDKTGGLTEALRLARAARAHKLGVMVGCMICTS